MLLTNRTWSGQEDQPVLGPEDLTCNEIAAIISDVVGGQVSYRPVPFEAFRGQLLGRGMLEDFADSYIAMMRAENEGVDNVAVRTPGTVGATHYRTWVETVLKPAIAD